MIPDGIKGTFPLSWPVGWSRSRTTQGARFGANGRGESFEAAVYRLRDELRRLSATEIVLSTNVPLKINGQPVKDWRTPGDAGVAVYFRLKGEARTLACDKWNRVADNIKALALHIEAVRGQVRWGVGSLEQAFGGYKALPAMGASKPWWEVLGVDSRASIDEVMTARDKLLRKHHPDVGGSHAVAAEVNAAAQEARLEIGAP